MATSAERKALMFLGTVIALGGGMRVVGASNSDALADKVSRDAIDAQIAAVDSVRRAGSEFGKRKGKGKGRRPKKPAIIVPAIVDIDIASADEIETLRWVGPALAARIVADRDSLGPFGSLRELERVR
ncbi:MAG: helix-hairpin-helix domain-containing protein, partial [Gemmatimonadaceae bacterium]